MRVKKVAIIGAGSRVQNTILPALHCLKHSYTIQAICSRTKKHITLPGGKTTIQTVTDIHKLDFASIDMIIVAATTESVPEILEQLVQHTVDHIVLFVDTPVVPIKDLGVIRHVRHFRAAYVSEDFIALANYQIVKKMVKKNHIGGLKHIYLFHNAYKYHALAMLKTLIGTNYVRLARITPLGNGASTVTIVFSKGVRATLVGPRDYSAGHFLITGDSGSIADYPITGNNMFHLKYQQNNKLYAGVAVAELPEFSHHSSIQIKTTLPYVSDTSLINSLKIEGLVTLYKNAFAQSPSFSYTPVDGVYDNVVFYCIEKIGFFADIKLPGIRRSIVYLLIEGIASIMKRRAAISLKV